MKRTVLPIVAALAAILGMISVARTRPRREPTVPPSAPPTSSFEQVVAGVGLVEANSENIDVCCAVSGMVTQLYVKAGDRVGQGQKLFSLDDRDLRADHQVKRTALEGAQARLAKLEQEPRAEDLPPAEERVREAQANLADAEVQVRLIESVTDKRAVRDEEVQRRRLAYKAAQARLAEVEAQFRSEFGGRRGASTIDRKRYRQTGGPRRGRSAQETCLQSRAGAVGRGGSPIQIGIWRTPRCKYD